MEEKELQAVYDAWRQFFVENKKNFEYIQIFENKGPEVGSSLPHPHCQIWSTQFLPTVIEKMFKNQENYFKKHKTSMLIDYLRKELEKKERIVKELEHFVVLVPYWAYWPYEMMILPKRNFHSIDQMSENESKDFMRAIQVLCRKYVKIFETPQIPYVMGLRSAPTGSYINYDFTCWTFHAIFYPPLLSNGRKKFMAGYELLAEVQRDFDTSIAAQRLRDVGE
ncbi:Galactose-1-phosphate uridylyltransferase [Aphelenchoides bicaudatus]|nr:Galactose-1-phosphate uridylyltransferase [Aphelenchoides bicaudatus]